MPILTLNGRPLNVEPGTTLLEAAQSSGIAIPTLCYSKGLPHHTSCMICVVQDRRSGKLLPACTALALDGMEIETDSAEARRVRTGSLNLLMSEHAGDCVAPCTTTCPAHLQIPLMTRQIADGKMSEALTTLHDTIALPAVLGRICPAPCEKACRRGRLDAPVSICLLERFVADEPLPAPAKAPATHHRVAIIGSGPTGLAAAFHLACAGHDCTLFDEHDQAGGQLRYGVPQGLLPPTILDREINRIQQLGVTFRLNTRIGVDVTLQELKAGFDAIVLAPGRIPPDSLATWTVEKSGKGLTVDSHTFRTSDDKIFAGGEAVIAGHLAVRAVAHGRAIALSIDQFLKGLSVTGPGKRFESRLGKIKEVESRELLKEASPDARVTPLGGPGTGLSREEAIRESRRCMHCDCRKADACKLRDYMETLMTGPMHVPPEGRLAVERNVTHPDVIFEPGKCVKCGICVRLTTQAGEKPGLAFLNRGFDAVVGIPFGETLEAGLGQSAARCVQACPTGALAWKTS